MLVFFNNITAVAQQNNAFVSVKDGKFYIGEDPYYYLGTNFWMGMNLGSAGPSGDRQRLKRELDHLKALGVTNLRIMAGSEGPDSEPWRMAPSLQPDAGEYNQKLLAGLDYLLYEMEQRNMKAVVCLNNFWMWSGGMAQYVLWNDDKASIAYPQSNEQATWENFIKYSEKFYQNKGAMQDFKGHIKKIVTRRNIYTQEVYKNDPTIMAWELANEPRGAHDMEAMWTWIDETSSYIKSLDNNHQVTTGSEGDSGVEGADFMKDHAFSSIDYGTVHIWIENRGWFDPKKPKTFEKALKKSRKIMKDHIAMSKKLNKPVVLEEFGVARDQGIYRDDASTQYRDRFYKEMFQMVYEASQKGDNLVGSNFWAWGGEGRPREPEGVWYYGDDFIGDPPHELQGWYSVYDTDVSTLSILSEYAEKMNTLHK